VAVEGNIQLGLVIFADSNGNVDMRVIAVIDATIEIVSVEIARMSSELEVVIAESKGSVAEYHCLYYSVSALATTEIKRLALPTAAEVTNSAITKPLTI
jgi:hypothetical protein